MLVTGGAGAIGAATAKLFADYGAHVVVVDLDADKAADAAKKAGNNSIGVGADITDPAAGPRRLRQGGRRLWRRRHPRLQRGRCLGRQDRRDRRRAAAQELRAQLLRPPVGGAERRAHHARSRAPAARCSSTPRSRRSIPARNSAPTACPRRRRCSCPGNMRSTTAPTASAPTPSTPTASAPAC